MLWRIFQPSDSEQFTNSSNFILRILKIWSIKVSRSNDLKTIIKTMLDKTLVVNMIFSHWDLFFLRNKHIFRYFGFVNQITILNKIIIIVTVHKNLDQRGTIIQAHCNNFIFVLIKFYLISFTTQLSSNFPKIKYFHCLGLRLEMNKLVSDFLILLFVIFICDKNCCWLCLDIWNIIWEYCIWCWERYANSLLC